MVPLFAVCTFSSDYSPFIAYLNKGVFQLSELTGQTIPVVMGNSLLIITINQISQNLNSVYEGEGSSTKAFSKSIQNYLYGHGPVGQF